MFKILQCIDKTPVKQGSPPTLWFLSSTSVPVFRHMLLTLHTKLYVNLVKGNS